MADDPAPAPMSPPPPPAPAAPAPAPPPAPKEPEVFSAEYVRELRGENKGLRLKAQSEEQARHAAAEEAKKAKETADAAVAEANTKAEQRAAEAEAKANERIIRAELRTVAIKAGMVDLDGLKLADLTEVKLDENGEVVGAEELMTKLKEAKPYLFGTGPGPSNPTPPPAPAPPGDKPVKDMTKAEYEAQKKAAIKASR